VLQIVDLVVVNRHALVSSNRAMPIRTSPSFLISVCIVFQRRHIVFEREARRQRYQRAAQAQPSSFTAKPECHIFVM
jgi:hypothetical protein